MSSAVLQAELGQRFILTVPQTEDKRFLAHWLEQTKPAGVMLLAYHVKTVARAKDYTQFLQEKAAEIGIPPLLIAIDWEGGVVSRPNDAGGFASIPSPWKLAQLGYQSCKDAGYCIGAQMKAIGVNMDFAPVLDLFGSRIMGTRPFHADPAVVAASGIAFSQGLRDAGVEPVIKHFPGLGLGMVDTHYDAVAIATDDAKLAAHQQPFNDAVKAGFNVVMVTHASYAQFGSLPLTRNPQVPALIKSLDSNAVAMTDDFFMAGAQSDVSEEEAIVQAVKAGYDLIIYSADQAVEESQLVMFNTLRARTDCEGYGETTAVSRLKSNLFAHLKSTAAVDHAVVKSISARLAQAAVAQPAIGSLRGKPLELITVNISALRSIPGFLKEPAEAWFATGGVSHLHKQLAAHGMTIARETILNAKDPASVEQVRAVVADLAQHPERFIIVQTYFHGGAVWNSHEEAWLRALQQCADRLLSVSLGYPTETLFFPEARVMTLGSFHRPLIDRVAAVLA